VWCPRADRIISSRLWGEALTVPLLGFRPGVAITCQPWEAAATDIFQVPGVRRSRPAVARGILIWCYSIGMKFDPSGHGSNSLGSVSTIRYERGFWMLFAYFGPEAMMPAASVIAAAIGVVMMFGRNILDYGRNLVDRVRPHPRRR
jgi:hypothetical protein